MDSLISTFHIDWKMILAQAINFGIVIFVLYRFALKPLKKLMDERGATIQGGLDNAKKQEELLANQEAEYKATLERANNDAAAKMKEAKKDMEAYRAAAMEKAQDEVNALIAAGKKQLESDKAAMLSEVHNEIVSMVISATEKVLGTAVTSAVDAKLVEENIRTIK